MRSGHTVLPAAPHATLALALGAQTTGLADLALKRRHLAFTAVFVGVHYAGRKLEMWTVVRAAQTGLSLELTATKIPPGALSFLRFLPWMAARVIETAVVDALENAALSAGKNVLSQSVAAVEGETKQLLASVEGELGISQQTKAATASPPANTISATVSGNATCTCGTWQKISTGLTLVIFALQLFQSTTHC